MTRLLWISIVLCIAMPAAAQAPDVAWPREVKAADGTVITVYQPQAERWAENRLSGRVTKSTFPGATQEESDKYLAILRGAVTKSAWPLSAQALQANLAIAQAVSKQKTLPVKNDPPRILFRTTPSLLVPIDGKPALRDSKEAP